MRPTAVASINRWVALEGCRSRTTPAERFWTSGCCFLATRCGKRRAAPTYHRPPQERRNHALAVGSHKWAMLGSNSILGVTSGEYGDARCSQVISGDLRFAQDRTWIGTTVEAAKEKRAARRRRCRLSSIGAFSARVPKGHESRSRLATGGVALLPYSTRPARSGRKRNPADGDVDQLMASTEGLSSGSAPPNTR